MHALIIPMGRAKQLRARKAGRTRHALIITVIIIIIIIIIVVVIIIIIIITSFIIITASVILTIYPPLQFRVSKSNIWQTSLPRLRLEPRPRLRPGFASKAASWHRVAMLLRFVEARLKTLEHVRQRDGVKDDSTARLLQRKLATYKSGVDEAAAVNAATIDSNALTPSCVDACVHMCPVADWLAQGFACALFPPPTPPPQTRTHQPSKGD